MAEQKKKFTIPKEERDKLLKSFKKEIEVEAEKQLKEQEKDSRRLEERQLAISMNPFLRNAGLGAIKKKAADIVSLDVPALIRLLEYAREELTSDAGGEKMGDYALHVLSTKLVDAKKPIDIIGLSKLTAAAKSDYGKFDQMAKEAKDQLVDKVFSLLRSSGKERE